jgi:beta-glucosidase
VFLDRPAILTEIAGGAAALVASFGAADVALLDLVVGRFEPGGKLPFELPSSMDAVLRQLPDVPDDSEAPLYPFGHGLTY